MNGIRSKAGLSSKEAVHFVQEILGIKSMTEKFDDDRAALLDEIISSFQEKIPFQTVTNVSRPQEDQHLSTMDEIKAPIFSCQGGLNCYDLNVFMKCLLEAIGYDAHLIGCNIGRNVGSHSATLVHDLTKPGDLHYVDVGVGEPFFQSIPLNFKKESRLYRSSYLTHKFIRNGESYVWFHEVNARYRPMSADDTVINGWNRFMEITLEPRRAQDFHKAVIRHYVTQPNAPQSFLNSLRCTAYPHRKMVAINNQTLLTEDSDGNIHKHRIQSKSELVSLYQKYFPQLPVDKVLAGIDNMAYVFDMNVSSQSV